MKEKTDAPSSLHQRILGDIEKRIVSGEWPPGFRLPFEVDLAKSYDVSRMTVNKVLTRLASAGLIERRKKSGSFVAQPRAQSAILEIHDIEAEVRSLKREYRFTVLSVRTRKANEQDIDAIMVGRKVNVIEVVCVHFAGDAPFCFESRLINLDVVPTAAQADFSKIPPGQWLRMEVPWTAAEHKIYAVGADDETSGVLDVPSGSPCLVVQRRTWCEQGPVTYVRFTYPADKHAIIATFTPAAAA